MSLGDFARLVDSVLGGDTAQALGPPYQHRHQLPETEDEMAAVPDLPALTVAPAWLPRPRLMQVPLPDLALGSMYGTYLPPTSFIQFDKPKTPEELRDEAAAMVLAVFREHGVLCEAPPATKRVRRLPRHC